MDLVQVGDSTFTMNYCVPKDQLSETICSIKILSS